MSGQSYSRWEPSSWSLRFFFRAMPQIAHLDNFRLNFSIKFISIVPNLNHPCSVMVYYFLFDGFLLISKLLFWSFLRFQGNFVRVAELNHSKYRDIAQLIFTSKPNIHKLIFTAHRSTDRPSALPPKCYNPFIATHSPVNLGCVTISTLPHPTRQSFFQTPQI